MKTDKADMLACANKDTKERLKDAEPLTEEIVDQILVETIRNASLKEAVSVANVILDFRSEVQNVSTLMNVHLAVPVQTLQMRNVRTDRVDTFVYVLMDSREHHKAV